MTGAPPRIAVIGAGGTIAGVAATRVSFHEYDSGRMPVADMVGALRPELGEVAEVTAADFAGDHHTVAGLCDLTRIVERALAEADAVVVTTGTNELGELAYWLDLTVRSGKPVVVTGAMRPWTVIGSDGPANLYNAVVLAADGRTRHRGVVVMLNDEIFAARDAAKTDTQRVDAFRSAGNGRLGVIDGPHVRLHRPSGQLVRAPFDVSAVRADDLPKVEIVPGYLDAGPEPLIAVAEAGAAGIVVAGPLSRRQKNAARFLAADGLTFVAAPHTPSGAAYPDASSPVIGSDLHPVKARLLLLLALVHAPHDPKSCFSRHAGQPTR